MKKEIEKQGEREKEIERNKVKNKELKKKIEAQKIKYKYKDQVISDLKERIDEMKNEILNTRQKDVEHA